MKNEAGAAAASTTRRSILVAGALGLTGLARTAQAQDNKPLRVGFISPNTGQLATFGVSNQYAHALLAPRLAAGVQTKHLGQRAVQVDMFDAASSPAVAARIAQELVAQGYHMLLAMGTPEICNPVSDVCEAAGVPCVTTVAPWQGWLFGRNGKTGDSFRWTYHFFGGIEDFTNTYSSLFTRTGLGNTVGGLFGDDIDGGAFLSAFPQALGARGLTLKDPGRLKLASPEYESVARTLHAAQVPMVTGVLSAPQAMNFVEAARRVGYQPRAIAIAKAFAFSEPVKQVMRPGMAIFNEVWWSPAWPFRSSLTGASAAEVFRDYEAKTGQTCPQMLGFSHALYELAAQVLRDTRELTREELRAALQRVRANTVVGPLTFNSRNPSLNICTTPAVGGQWFQKPDGRYVLEVVDNARSPFIPITAQLRIPEA